MENECILKRVRSFHNNAPSQQKTSTSMSLPASGGSRASSLCLFLVSWHRTSQTCNVPEEKKATAALTWKKVGGDGGEAEVLLRGLANSLVGLCNKRKRPAEQKCTCKRRRKIC